MAPQQLATLAWALARLGCQAREARGARARGARGAREARGSLPLEALRWGGEWEMWVCEQEKGQIDYVFLDAR